jgi:hypothetical protein
VKVKGPIEPDARQRGVYDERYAEFQELYRRTRGMFARMNRRSAGAST